MGIAPEPFHRQYGLRLPVDIFRGAILLKLSKHSSGLMFGTPMVMNNFPSKREFGVWNPLRTVTPFLVSTSRSTSSPSSKATKKMDYPRSRKVSCIRREAPCCAFSLACRLQTVFGWCIRRSFDK